MNLFELVHNSVVSFASTIYSDRFEPNKISFQIDNSLIFPCINKKSLEIKYGLRTDILLYLYNSSNQKLFYYYYITLVCFQNNDFISAEKFFYKLVSEIESTPDFIPNDVTTIINKLTYQSLFCILHEIGHAIFFLERDSKEVYIKESLDCTKEFLDFWNSIISNKENVNQLLKLDTIKELSKSDYKYFINDFSILFQNGFIEDVINNNSHNKSLEELGADCFAIYETSKIIEVLNFNHTSSVEIYSEYLNIIQCLSNKTYIDQLLFLGGEFNTNPLNLRRTISSLAIILPHFPQDETLTDCAFKNLIARYIVEFVNESKSILPNLSSLSKGKTIIDQEYKHKVYSLITQLETEICELLTLPNVD